MPRSRRLDSFPILFAQIIEALHADPQHKEIEWEAGTPGVAVNKRQDFYQYRTLCQACAHKTNAGPSSIYYHELGVKAAKIKIRLDGSKLIFFWLDDETGMQATRAQLGDFANFTPPPPDPEEDQTLAAVRAKFGVAPGERGVIPDGPKVVRLSPERAEAQFEGKKALGGGFGAPIPNETMTRGVFNAVGRAMELFPQGKEFAIPVYDGADPQKVLEQVMYDYPYSDQWTAVVQPSSLEAGVFVVRFSPKVQNAPT